MKVPGESVIGRVRSNLIGCAFCKMSNYIQVNTYLKFRDTNGIAMSILDQLKYRIY